MLAATEPVQKQARHVLERAFESIELSFRAAKLGTVAVNRKLIDIARTNVSSSFDLAMGLATAKTPMETAQLQMAFFDQHMKTLAAQSAGAPHAPGRARARSEHPCAITMLAVIAASLLSAFFCAIASYLSVLFQGRPLRSARAQSHQCGAARRKAGTTIQQLTAAATDAATTRLNAVARP